MELCRLPVVAALALAAVLPGCDGGNRGPDSPKTTNSSTEHPPVDDAARTPGRADVGTGDDSPPSEITPPDHVGQDVRAGDDPGPDAADSRGAASPADRGDGAFAQEDDDMGVTGSLLGSADGAWTTSSGDTVGDIWGRLAPVQDSAFGFGGLGVVGTGRGGAGTATAPGLGSLGTTGRGSGSGYGSGAGRGYGAGSSAAGAVEDDVLPEGTIARYPTIEAPPSVVPDREFAVMVSLSTSKITTEVKIEAGASTEDGQLVMQLPEDRTSWELDVVLSAPGFELREGVNTGRIVLPQDGDSTPAMFRLTALPPEDATPERKLFATFWYEGGYVARVSRPVTVRGAGTRPSADSDIAQGRAANPPSSAGQVPSARTAVSQLATPPSGRQPDITGARPLQLNAPVPTSADAAGDVAAPRPSFLDLERRQPDLTLFLLRGLDSNRPGQFEVVISSPYLQPTRAAYDRPPDFEAWLQQQYSVLSSLSARGVTTGGAAPSAHAVARDRIEGFGEELYERFVPDAVKEAFWTLSDRLGEDFDVIQIYSDDPVFPWELVRPFRDDSREDRDFLGLDFMIGRWHVAGGTRQREQPPQALPVQGLAFWAPDYEGALRLPGQQQELALLTTLEGFSQWPGRLDVIGRLFASSSASIVHFSGHGVVAPGSAGLPESRIVFEDGELDVIAWRRIARRVRRLAESRPLFFFNACEVGQTEAVAGYVEGWAPAVLEAGASGYIGALWPIGDSGAASFSGRFYSLMQDRLATGAVPVAELVRESRRLFLEDPDPTYLAYVYYGDPQLELVTR